MNLFAPSPALTGIHRSMADTTIGLDAFHRVSEDPPVVLSGSTLVAEILMLKELWSMV